jgi:hypothetical protein
MSKTKRSRKWSAKVTETSDALDLRKGVFELDDPRAIAASLKRSAEHSKRRKGSPLQSAMPRRESPAASMGHGGDSEIRSKETTSNLSFASWISSTGGPTTSGRRQLTS